MTRAFFLRLATVAGWRRNVLAFSLGICATLTLPPLFVFPLIIPAFAGLFLLIANAPSYKRAFWDGWWWGWGYYITGIYWVCIALMTEPDKFAWMLPFALFGLTAVIAIYSGVACLLTSLSRTQGLLKLFTFTVIWMVMEFARGHLFTGYPWNLAGYSFAFSDATLQLASIVGAYGMTWWAVWLGAVPASLLYDRRRFIVASYIMFIVLTAWGQWRLLSADIPSERDVPGVMLRLVQANIAQHHKWDPKLQMDGLQKHIRLTRSPGLDRITHVIWPETAVPYPVKANTTLTRVLGAAVPPGVTLISGTLREEGDTDESWQLWNSLMAFDHQGNIVGSYDKFKLVPFGEFVPFREFLPDSLLTPVGMKDFSRGPGPQTLNWPNLPPLSPLICYEAIFPELAVNKKDRPAFMLNVTNDAWFGISSGPHQHFHMARMRAVEQGMPLVRVANTGITAITDSYGRVLGKLELGNEGILDVSLPKVDPNSTIYSEYGNKFLWFLVFLNVGLSAIGQGNHKKTVKFLLQVVRIRK